MGDDRHVEHPAPLGDQGSDSSQPDHAERFSRQFDAGELAALAPAVSDGLVVIEADGGLSVTPTGRLLVRNIAMEFDAYLPEQRRSGRPMFSRTV